MQVAEVVGRTLARYGVRTAFGLVGSGNFTVTAALVAGGVRFVAARHEMGAVVMAGAYARVSGELAVCTVHQGPGLSNAVTGIAEAAKSRTPLLVVAADTAGSAVRSNFRIDQAALVESVGAVAERVHTPGSAVADVARAVRRARDDRRTVVLNLPLDVQAAETVDVAAPVLPALAAPRPAATAIERVAGLLAGAERPLLLAGRGAALSDAGPALRRLAERTGALLATTAVAHALFAADPWNLGISGGVASPAAAELIADSDLVLAFGASLTMWTTRHGRLLPPEIRVVQVDLEADAIGASHRVTDGILGDCAATAEDLLAALPPGSRPGRRTAGTAARMSAGSWPKTPYDDASGAGGIDPRTLSIALDVLMPAERTIAVDSGHFLGWPAMYWRVPDERAFVFAQAFQSVGLGLASAIGAAIARPDRLAVAALGDGGLLMGVAELETVARLGLPMLLVVYNDAAYGAEVHHFRPSGAPLDLVRFPDTDLAAIARGFGLAGCTVRTPDDLAAVRDWLAGPRERALLVDAKIEPTVVADWLEEAFRGH